MKYIKWISLSVISIIIILYGIKFGYFFYLNSLPKESRYLIPEGYVGWIVIDYLMEDYPAIPEKEGLKIIKIPSSGIYKTSHSPMSAENSKGRYGDEFIYYSGDKLTPIPNELTDWGGNIGRIDDNGHYYEFRIHLWVGTQEQYATYGMQDYSNPKPGPIFPLDTKTLDNQLLQ